MAKDFLHLIDSFNLVQSVCGHTLDLVLSFGLPVLNLEICDAVFSDHMPVLFEIALACNTVESRAAPRPCRIINPFTAVQFSSVFSHTRGYRCDDSEELMVALHLSNCHRYCGSIEN